jgi:TP901 family phage tail tape measure protein
MASSAGAVRAGGAFVEIFAKDGAFQQSMKRVENRIRAVGTAIRSVGSNLFFGTAAIGAPIALAVRQFASLDDAVRASAAAAGRGQESLAGMAAAAERMGLRFGLSSVDVAKLGLEISRAFGDRLSEQEINSVTEAVLAMAKATGTDGTRAASIMASTLAQFGLNADQAARVADTLTFTANATLNSVDGLGEALSYAGGAAANAGLDIEQTLAVLGTLGNLGLQGSEAGTALRRLLTISGADAQKLSEIFGVSFLDINGNIRPIVDSLTDVSIATQNLAGGERIAKLSEAFGLLGINAAIGIGRAGDSTRKLEADIRAATGTANQQAAFMEAGVGGAMRQLLEAIRQIGNAFGEALAPAIVQASKTLGSFAVVIKQFVSTYPQIARFVAGTIAGLFAIGVVLIPLGFAFQAAATGLAALRVALSIIPALASPVGLAVAGIGLALAGVIVVAREVSPEFRSMLDAMAQAVSNGNLSGAFEILTTQLAVYVLQIMHTLENGVAGISNGLSLVGALIADTLIGGLDAFMGLFGADILTLQAGFEKLGVYLRAAFDWQFLANGMQQALDDIDKRIAEERARLPTADSRASARTADRQRAADARQKADNERAERQAREIDTAREEARRARREQTAKPTEQPAGAAGPATPPAAPAAIVPPAPVGTSAASESKIGATLGGFNGTAGLGIGPELAAMADPAKDTAENTRRTAEGIDSLVADFHAAFPPGGGGAAGVTSASGAARDLAAAAAAGELPAGGAVANAGAVAGVPPAAAAARAGTRAASELDSLASLVSSGFRQLITEVQNHAKISQGHTDLLKRIRDNTAHTAGGFA